MSLNLLEPCKPWCFDVEVTAKCSTNCPYCYNRGEEKHMSRSTADQVLRLVAKAWEDKPLSQRIQVNLYGGEPFENFPIVRYLVTHAESQKLPVDWTIFTNGATATQEQVEFCKDHGIKPKRSTAGCPESAALTRPGRYMERYLRESHWWGDWNSSRRITVIPATAKYLVENVRWMHQNGFYGPLDFQPDYYVEWPEEAQEAFVANLTWLAEEVIRLHRRGFVLAIENFQNFGRVIFGQSAVMTLGCGAGTSTLGVDYAGRMVACHRSFRESENSPLLVGDISGILMGNLNPSQALVSQIQGWQQGTEREECLRCSARQCCPRGCLHVSRVVSGDLQSQPKFRCKTIRWQASVARHIGDELGGDDPQWWKASPTRTCPISSEE